MTTIIRSFTDMSIGAKLGLAMALLAAALTGLTLLGYFETKASLLEDRVMTTRLETETARSLVAHYEKQAASGALSLEDAKKQALRAVAELRYGQNDYFFVFNLEGVVVAHNVAPKLVGANVLDRTDVPGGKRLFLEMRDVAAANGSGDVYYMWPRASGGEPVEKVAHVELFKPWGWVIATGLYLDDVQTTAKTRGLTSAAWSLVFALPVLVLLGLVRRSVTRPISEITKAMRALAAGDLSTEVPAKGRRDEIGAIAEALQVFKDAMIAKRDLDEAAARDADEKVRRAQRLDEITSRFEGNVASLTQGVSAAAAEMEATAQSLLSTADRANEQASSVAAAAGQTSVNVETVAAATEEMSASVQEISGQVATSSKMADKAADEARRTGEIVRALSEGADKIGAVAGMIATIANQTNLLALNATIEAARAGEAGRGFAVVAAEVKALAGQTAQATAEIEESVAAVQASTRDAVSAIGEISRTVTDMSGVAASVAAAIEQQDAATREILRNVSQAARGTQEVTASITEVSAGAGQTSAASTQVLGAAKELARYSHDLGREVESFLSGVKAA